MKLSAVRLAAATGLVASGLAAVTLTSSSPASADPLDWCTPAAAPCIESLSHNSSLVLPTDTTWQAELDVFDNGGAYTQMVFALRHNGSLALPAGETDDTWSITINTGSTVPRVVNAFGRNGVVTRSNDGSYHVTVTAKPTLVSFGCDYSPYPWPCWEDAISDEVRFSGTIDDWRQWEPVEQREAFYGVDFFSNIEVTSFPPGVNYDDATGIAAMRLDFAAPHYQSNGVDPVTGHFEATLPNEFLKHNFFVPNPTTMPTSSLLVAGAGPSSSATVTRASTSDPMYVEVTNMTFPTATVTPSPRSARLGANDAHIRKMRVKTGTIVPTRPTGLDSVRVTPSKAKVFYELSTPRGSNITGYTARCESPGGHVVRASRTGNESPVVVTGLNGGTPYACKVRARSKAGPGPWSEPVQVARRP